MQTGLRGRDLISLADWTNEEIETALDVAFELKRKRALGESHAYLRDKTLAMLFFFSSTRTRASFEAGMAQLGGHGLFIESRTTPFRWQGVITHRIAAPNVRSQIDRGAVDRVERDRQIHQP